MRTGLAAITAVLALAAALTPAAAHAQASAPASCLAAQSQLQEVPGSASSVAGSTPVVFIHGMTSSPQLWRPSSASSISGQAARLSRVTAWTFGYAAESLDWVTNPEIGPALVRALGCLAQVSGHKAIIVAHSMGGLASQYALAQPDRYAGGTIADHVSELVTLGTPYDGSEILTIVQDLRHHVQIDMNTGEVRAVEALMSLCAGKTSGFCGLLNVVPYPVGTALEEGSPEIAQLPPWPSGMPVLDIAGDLDLHFGIGDRGLTVNFGDGAVTLASATAHDTTGTPLILHCNAALAALTTDLIADPGPCFHTHLPHDASVIAAVLAVIRADSVTPLSLQLVPDPPTGPDVTTVGDYIQLTGAPDLAAVNTGLRGLITGSEQNLMTAIGEHDSSPPPGVGPGDFGSQPYQGQAQVSASSDVASALIPVTSVLPGGNDGEIWASGTYLVPSGAPVSLQSLFATPSQGMAEMARLARTAFTARYPCVAQDASAFGGGDPYEPDWAPTAANYRYWSMTPAGLSIGFVNGVVADEACGRMEVTLTWSQLHPWLSASALQLIAALRSVTLPSPPGPPCTAAEFLNVISQGDPDLYGWGPLKYACAGGWAVVAGVSTRVGFGVAFLQSKAAGWSTTGLQDGACLAATSKKQCPFPPQLGVPPHALLLQLVHEAGLTVNASGSVGMPGG